MWDTALGLALSLVVFFAIGLGPAAAAFRGPARWTATLGLAAPLGLTLTIVFGTFACQSGWPVERWWVPFTLAACLVSLLLLLAEWVRLPPCPDRREALELRATAAAFAVVFALSVAPFVIGGLSFTVYRGNGEDSISYVTMAGYLDRAPIETASRTSPAAMLQAHQSWVRAQTQFDHRWASGMLLAYSSHLGGSPPIRFEYPSSVGWLLMTFGPLFLLSRAAAIGFGPSLLVAAAGCVGFWTQLVLDIRALGHLNSMPLIVGLLYVVATIEQTPSEVGRRAYVVAGLLGGALVLCYPEIVPTVGLAVGVGLIGTRWRGGSAWGGLWPYLASLAVMALTVLPMSTLVLDFSLRQLSAASSQRNNWEQAWFPFLYAQPLRALWGLACLVNATSAGLRSVIRIGLSIWAALLTMVVIVGLARGVSRRETKAEAATSLVIGVAIAAAVQCAYLLAMRQWWAAGKALTYGMPVMLLLPVLAVGWMPRWRTTSGVLVFGWLALQVSLGVLRGYVAAREIDFPNYVRHHAAYRRFDWDFSPLVALLRPAPGASIRANVADPYLSDYVALVIGYEHRLCEAGAIRDVAAFDVGRRPRCARSDFLIAPPSETSGESGFELLARTRDLALFRLVAHASTFLTGLTTPNGLEEGGGVSTIWLGGGPTRIHYVSELDTSARLRARTRIGPSLPGSVETRVRISDPDSGWRVEQTVRDGRFSVCLPVRKGANDILIEVLDPPRRFLASDPRPLLLQMQGPELQQEACTVPG